MMGRRAFLVVLGCVACSAEPSRSIPPPPTVVSTPAASTELADRDQDGVPDVCDWCPGRPGVNDVHHPYGRGCPYIDEFVSNGDRIGALSVSFEGHVIQGKLDHLVEVMNGIQGVRFFVIGHAAPGERDPDAAAAERAHAVVMALEAAGVSSDRFIEHSAGADSLASRRVTFDVDHDRCCTRAWNETTRIIEAVPLGELPSCPPSWIASHL